MVFHPPKDARCAGRSEALFNNVALRLRGKGCIIASTSPPFVTVHWPDLAKAASVLGLSQATGEFLTESEGQRRFLATMADGPMKDERFRPARIGFRAGPGEIRSAEGARRAYRRLVFVGVCSSQVLFASLEAVAATLPRGGTLDVEFKRWDFLADWQSSEERLREVYSHLAQNRGVRANFLVFSRLQEVDSTVWEFVYNYPRVRIGWVAEEMLSAGEKDGVADHVPGIEPLSRLAELASTGLWPHIVLPVARSNVRCLAELVSILLEVTRGASIDLVPAPFLASTRGIAPPPVRDYIEALLALYSISVPMRLISPLSWVAQRMDSQTPLIRSAVSIGAEIAVLPGGDMYAGECGVGFERWRIGNVLTEFDAFRWERLDIMPEAFSNAAQPERCQLCDWRYRCGGLDASVFMLQERGGAALAGNGGSQAEGGPESNGDTRQRRRRGKAVETAEVRATLNTELQRGANGSSPGMTGIPSWSDLAELYCAPRKALFEEMLWSWAETAARGAEQRPRERLELSREGIAYVPVTTQ